MKKVLKYDFLDNYAGFLAINTLIFFCIIGIGFLGLDFYGRLDTLVFILYGALFIGSFFWVVMLVLAILNSINKKLFSAQGYLTFLLPVSIDSILISKILINVFWLFCSITLLYIALYISRLINPQAFQIIATLTYYPIFSKPLYALYFYINIFASFALLLVKFLFILSLLNIGKIKKNRFIKGFFIFLGLEILISLIRSIIWNFAPDSYVYSFNYGFFQSSYQNPNPIPYLTEISTTILQILIFYFLTRFLIKNKLELQ